MSENTTDEILFHLSTNTERDVMLNTEETTTPTTDETTTPTTDETTTPTTDETTTPTTEETTSDGNDTCDEEYSEDYEDDEDGNQTKTGSHLFVISVDSVPTYYVINEYSAKRQMWDVAKSLAGDMLFSSYNIGYEEISDNEIRVVGFYRLFLVSYDKILHRVTCHKVKKYIE